MRRALLLAWLLVSFTIWWACSEEECADCGGTVAEGYLFKHVTGEDLQSLPGVEGLKLESCIRFQVLIEEGIDPNTVAIVDDCCCNLYGTGE